jgi:hypothetical protein
MMETFPEVNETDPLSQPKTHLLDITWDIHRLEDGCGLRF